MLSSILIFILVLSVLVMVHELGHFLVARRAGIWVEEFGFGLPPRIFGKKVGETVYSINLLPFGGFVKLHGESSEEENVNKKRSFMEKGVAARLAVLFAGVVMNFILAVLLFAISYSISGIPKDTGKIKLVEIAVSSPAQIAGLLSGDIVKSVDKVAVSKNEDFIKLVEAKKGKKIQLEIERVVGGETTTKKITLTPRASPPENEGPLGVTVSTVEIYYPPIYQRPFYGAYYGFTDAIFWGKTVLEGFGKIGGDLLGGRIPKDVSGPVGIFAVTTEAAKFGALALINFMGILSVNLAILNVLPFPALDGGRIFFVLVEKIMGRKVLPKIEATTHTIGMIVLLVLLLAVTVHDIQRLILAGSLSNFIESVLK